MKLGIFAKTFSKPNLEGILDAVLFHGLDIIHFNYSCVGLPPMPDEIPQKVIDQIKNETQTRGIELAGVSGTFNMIDPDMTKRDKGLKRLEVIAKSCKGINAPLITLCTGTRDPNDMWKEHPDNTSPQAWKEMIASMRQAIRIAEKEGVYLGIEPEIANVVDSCQKAKQLLEEMGSDRLKIVIDPANLFRPTDVPYMKKILQEAFKLLYNDIAMAHAKDFLVDNGSIVHVAAGKGIIDYETYLDLLKDLDVPLIMHGLKEEEVDVSMNFIKTKLLPT